MMCGVVCSKLSFRHLPMSKSAQVSSAAPPPRTAGAAAGHTGQEGHGSHCAAAAGGDTGGVGTPGMSAEDQPPVPASPPSSSATGIWRAGGTCVLLHWGAATKTFATAKHTSSPTPNLSVTGRQSELLTIKQLTRYEYTKECLTVGFSSARLGHTHAAFSVLMRSAKRLVHRRSQGGVSGQGGAKPD